MDVIFPSMNQWLQMVHVPWVPKPEGHRGKLRGILVSPEFFTWKWKQDAPTSPTPATNLEFSIKAPQLHGRVDTLGPKVD